MSIGLVDRDVVEAAGSLRVELARLVKVLDVEVLSAGEAVAMVEATAAIERLAGSARAMATRRVADLKAWKAEGDRSAAHWAARKAGSSVTDAVASLDAMGHLGDLPAVEEAMRRGELSPWQASEVASAAALDPSVQDDLVRVAREGSAPGLRDRCRKTRAAAAGSNASDRYMRTHRSRYVRSWNEPDGAFRLSAKLTPDDGARLLAAVDLLRERLFRQARSEGRREGFEAYRADALVALADHRREPAVGGGAPVATVNVLVDYTALERGHVEGGEVCEIPGVGPIPVATAKAMLSDSVLKVLVTKGTDIAAVAHGGRTIPAKLRSALEARDPTCVVPGCDARFGLEIDHLVPFADGGPTSLENTARLCRWHHVQKTHAGWSLTRPSTGWYWHQPP